MPRTAARAAMLVRALQRWGRRPGPRLVPVPALPAGGWPPAAPFRPQRATGAERLHRTASQVPSSSDGEHDAPDPELWDLVRAAQGGDGEAFGAIYDRYVDVVYRFVHNRVHGDRALAEDLTSETFLRALRRFGTVTYQGRDLGAFFITIARNLVYDHAKSARFRFEIVTDDLVEPEPGQGAEAEVLVALTNQRLLEAVGELPDEQQECISLRFLSGLSVAETAQVMGKNEGAVKAMQHRAVKRLHGLLGEELGE